MSGGFGEAAVSGSRRQVARFTEFSKSSSPFLAGIALCAALAGVATLGAKPIGVPVMLAVLVLGIGVRAAAPGITAWSGPGIQYCAKCLLRIGVALLGLRIVVGDLVALGPSAILLVVGSLAATVSGGFLLARMLRLPRETAAISATSVAVCGASAALAASAVFPKQAELERVTTVIIVAVSILSTIVMVAYPWLARMIGYSGLQTSLMLGAAIHDVAQVAGAGFAVSPEVGVQSVTVKMIRVACLLPVVLSFGWLLTRRARTVDGAGDSTVQPPPLFLIAFFVLAAIASTGLVPKPITGLGSEAAGWALTVAVAAIGLKTSLRELGAVPPALLAALIGQTILQLGVVIALITILFG